jgi:hypothetical protein
VIKRGENKRGQVTIFIIIALAFVAIILVVFLFPRLGVITTEVNPNSFMKTCMESDLRDAVQRLSRQGGYFEPTNYLMYEDDRIQFLCYTSQNYEPCLVQQPLLVGHVKKELTNYIEPRARGCVEDLKEQFESQGFRVDSTPGMVEVDIVSGSMTIDFLSPMTVTKENTQRFEKFSVRTNSEWYDLLITATSILQFESTMGDAEISSYIQFYPDLKIEKIRREGDTVYKLKNVVTGDEFTFASRSLVWPPGYGFDEVLP